MEDWEFSAEELDFLERDALKQIAHRKSSSVAATTSNASCPAKPIYDKIDASSIALQKIEATATSNVTDSSEKHHEVLVKLFLHASGNVAAKFLYDQVVVEAFRKIPAATWNAKERLWIFPVSSLSTMQKILEEIRGYRVQVENLDPLVQRAIAAASTVPDLRGMLEKLSASICHLF